MKKSTISTVFIFIVITILLVFGFSSLQKIEDKEDFKRVEEALSSSVIACYSIEGSYPESLDYLKENYGFYFNDDLYQIHFRYLGANVKPEYKVFLKGNKWTIQE